MFVKPFNLIIVYILTIINFVILLLPFVAILALAIKLDQQLLLEKIQQLNLTWFFYFLIFIISFLMLIYLFFDFIFGFSVRTSLKNCKRYDKLKELEFLKTVFEQAQTKFGRYDIKLYISNSKEINAFAVGSMGKKVIVLTRGLIAHTLNNSDNQKEFLLSLRSIIGHEMSHLVNKDYLPALLIIVNQKATNLVSKILELSIKLPLYILGFFRFKSRIIFDFIMFIYKTANRIFTFFNAKIIFNLYEFIRKFISRSIEYRCDRQSAQAFGGNNMARALSLFGSSGYFTLFSTHPNTKSRIKKVLKIEKKDQIIVPLTSSSISNYLALMALFIVCALSAKISKADLLIRYYLIEHNDVLLQKVSFLVEKGQNLWSLVSSFTT